MKRVFAYDGTIGRLLLAIFQFFIVSVQFLATAAAVVLHDRIIGWQSTHLAIWLGALALLPAGPGMYAVLASMRDFLAEGGYPGAPIRRFWRAYRDGVTRLWWWWLGSVGFAAMLGYDAALFGALDGVIVAASIAVCCAALAGVRGHPLHVIAVALGSAVARPHILLTWLFLVAAAAGASAIPVLGPSLVLFLPALAGWAILIVNATTGLDAKLGAADA